MADWEHFHSGYSDHWFFSNPEIMKKIGNIYDELYNYYQINSEFYKYVMILVKKYNNNGFMTKSHTIHEFYLNSHQIILSKIKILRFNGN